MNLIAVAHYLDALEWQKEIVKIHAVFGGKNPHPNYLVGGVPCSIDVDEVAAINGERLNLVSTLIAQADEFVNQVYDPDLLAVASFYKDWAQHGGGLKNYLAYGEYPTKGYSNPDTFKFARGAILGRDLSHVYPGEPARRSGNPRSTLRTPGSPTRAAMTEGFIPGRARRRSPTRAPSHRSRRSKGMKKYSFLKTPRWKENPMEVGPLARLLVSYAAGRADVKETVNATLGKLNVPVDALFSTLGRTAARGIDCALSMIWLKEFYNELIARVKTRETSTFNGEKWEPSTWPSEAEGVGLVDAPRGALAHWIKIKNGAIDNYQLVVPTTWNGSPRDARSARSAFEESLIGTPVANLEQPVEIIRTIHSFDPCLACAVHLYDPQGRHLHQVSFE